MGYPPIRALARSNPTGVSCPLLGVHSILRFIFDPGSTDFLKFFDLYPKQGGLLGMLVDQGAVKTMEALFLTRPLVLQIVEASIMSIGLFDT